MKISWTGDADVDVMVEEPAGTVCSLRNRRTTSGGVLLGDTFAHASDHSSELSETYVCPEGFQGRYRVLVRRIWGDVTAGKVTVDVYTNQHTPQEKHIRQQIPLADKDALVVFEVPQGRRTESLTEHQIASVANAQAAINRAVLAQQLNSVSESEAVTRLAVARAAANGGPWPFFRGGAVGYRPEITSLPEGAMLSATAVISADRRYVRFSGLPFFSVIGEVTTFNFVTGNTGAGGGTRRRVAASAAAASVAAASAADSAADSDAGELRDRAGRKSRPIRFARCAIPASARDNERDHAPAMRNVCPPLGYVRGQSSSCGSANGPFKPDQAGIDIQV